MAVAEIEEIPAIRARLQAVLHALQHPFTFARGRVNEVEVLQARPEHGGSFMRSFVLAHGMRATAKDLDLLGEVVLELDHAPGLEPPERAAFGILVGRGLLLLERHDLDIPRMPHFHVRFLFQGVPERLALRFLFRLVLLLLLLLLFGGGRLLSRLRSGGRLHSLLRFRFLLRGLSRLLGTLGPGRRAVLGVLRLLLPLHQVAGEGPAVFRPLQSPAAMYIDFGNDLWPAGVEGESLRPFAVEPPPGEQVVRDILPLPVLLLALGCEVHRAVPPGEAGVVPLPRVQGAQHARFRVEELEGVADPGESPPWRGGHPPRSGVAGHVSKGRVGLGREVADHEGVSRSGLGGEPAAGGLAAALGTTVIAAWLLSALKARSFTDSNSVVSPLLR